MKKCYVITAFLIAVCMIGGCKDNVLNTRIDTQQTDETVANNYNLLSQFGYAAYTQVHSGFSVLDNNLFAAATDEAEETHANSEAQLFNEASWNEFNNPDNVWAQEYKGIRAAHVFLKRSKDYKDFLALDRDTISSGGKTQYHLDVKNIGWMRGEAHVLIAYYYFQLAKRYGGVPLVKKILPPEKSVTDIPQVSFDKVINYIVKEIDSAKDSLQTDWNSYDVSKSGRITKGAALALKSQVLLFPPVRCIIQIMI
jgi:hypothetical protein